MVPRFNLKSNAVWALVEVLVSALAVFLVYRVLALRFGVGAVGVWSLVVATAALARFADAGATAGVIRHVARAIEAPGPIAPTTYIHTAAIFNAAVFSVAAAALYPLAALLIGSSIQGRDLDMAMAVLPFVLATVPASILSTTLCSGIVGLHRSSVKSAILIAGQAVNLAVFLLAVGRHGILAAAFGQIAQALAVTALSLAWMRRAGFARAPILSRPALMEMLSIGLRVQVANLTSLASDLLVKYLIPVFSSTEALGYFEMAQRFVLQVRQLVNGPVQILVPAFSGLSMRGEGELRAFYIRSVSVALGLGIPLMAAAILASPLVSFLFVERVSPDFVAFVVLLAIGWSFSLVASPGYLLATAVGVLRWNIIGNLCGVATLGALGALLGPGLASHGVVIAFAISLILGNLLMISRNARLVGAPAWPGFRHLRQAMREVAAMRRARR